MRVKRIDLAGGCFWGMQAYFQDLPGILETEVGYANGLVEQTSYSELSRTDHAETLRILYDAHQIRLQEILLHFFRIIDPFSVNRQGGDVGRQYRTAVFYAEEDQETLVIARQVFAFVEKKWDRRVAVLLEPLRQFVSAEQWHQDYLRKNPNGYCHISLADRCKPLLDWPKDAMIPAQAFEDEVVRQVMCENQTEHPFSSVFAEQWERGLYVSAATGEPLFLSEDQFDAGCGWPSFVRPVFSESVRYVRDESWGMSRTEVRSAGGAPEGLHLGHVFADGPKVSGGLRYCINGVALRFIPWVEMEKLGYGDFQVLFRPEGISESAQL